MKNLKVMQIVVSGAALYAQLTNISEDVALDRNGL
jgi:hypothetical protein